MVREYIYDTLGKCLGKDNFAVLLGMLIGNTIYLDNNIEEDFKSSGITHLLAVSGSNVSYVILFTHFVLSKIFPKKISNIVSIFMIVLFMLVAGASASVVRATIMAIIVIVSDLIYKKPDTLSSVLASAFIILLINPFSICDVGFVLSFGGTIGIIILNKRVTCFLFKLFLLFKEYSITKYIVNTLSITISAQIVLLPIMWYYFNTISFVSVLTNMFAVPLSGIITIYGIVVCFVRFLSLNFAQLLSTPLNYLLKLLLAISNLFSKIPFGNISLPTIHVTQIVLYYAIFYFLTKEKKEKTYLFFFVVLISSACVFFGIISLLPKSYVSINFIDVGQGDSTHIITLHNKNVLIDGGGSENSDYNVGENVLVPYLYDNSNCYIDAIFVSHFHDDHAEGIISVLNTMNVGKIFIGKQPKKTPLYEDVLKIAKNKKIPIYTLYAGQVITIDNIKIEVLFPTRNYTLDDLNNSSLILKVTIFNKSILFTGDAELNEEENILNYYYKESNKLDVDVLKVGHHGSKTSSSEKFLDTISPYVSIISCGVDNKFKHPHKEALDRIYSKCKNIYRTDIHGQIQLKIYSNGKMAVSAQL